MHINCSGDQRPGQPAVILEAGSSASSVEWSLVPPEGARFARVFVRLTGHGVERARARPAYGPADCVRARPPYLQRHIPNVWLMKRSYRQGRTNHASCCVLALCGTCIRGLDVSPL